MIKQWFEQYRTRNYFNPSTQEVVKEDDLVKILEGRATYDRRRDSMYFIVCRNGLDVLQGNKPITVSDVFDKGDSVFDSSEWFGKFEVGDESHIIVPGEYDLRIEHQARQLFFQATQNAKYYGSGHLQYDKDSRSRVLRTDVSFEELREIVNSCCSEFEYAHSLQAWNN